MLFLKRKLHFLWSLDAQMLHVLLPYMMKIYTECNLATWLRLVKLAELNISQFWFLNFDYMRYHWDISKNIMISGIWILGDFPSAKFSSCRVYTVDNIILACDDATDVRPEYLTKNDNNWIICPKSLEKCLSSAKSNQHYPRLL